MTSEGLYTDLRFIASNSAQSVGRDAPSEALPNRRFHRL